MSRYRTIYVEGPNDRVVLEKLFPQIQGTLTPGSGKTNVLKKVVKEHDCFGIVDRDLDQADLPLDSGGTVETRLAVLDRYCMESYLLEPGYLFAYAKEYGISHLENWQSEEAVLQYLIRKGQELCFYSAANETVDQIKRGISFRALTQKFDELPILEEHKVRERLEERFRGLPTRDAMSELLANWERRSKEMRSCCESIEGVHRWIDGKVLLRKVIVQDIRQTDTKRFATYNDEEFIDDLLDLEVMRTHPPAGLAAILTNIGLLS